MSDADAQAWWECDLDVATPSLAFPTASHFTSPTPPDSPLTPTNTSYPYSHAPGHDLEPLFALQQLQHSGGTWSLESAPQFGQTHLPYDPSSLLYDVTGGTKDFHYSQPPLLTVGELLNQVPDRPLPAVSGIEGTSVMPPKKTVGGMPFTKRLRSLLANPGQYSDCLVWDQEGKSFIVSTSSHRLLHDVLPKAFGHSNIASFNRQLNVYGFSRIPPTTLYEKLELDQTSSTASYNGWYHADFNRDTNDWVRMTPRPSRARAARKIAREQEKALERERLRNGMR